MKNKLLLLVLTLLFSITINAQKTASNLPIKNPSIYTSYQLYNDENDFTAINKKLKLNNFKFVFVNLSDLEYDRLSVDLYSLYNTPSNFIFDDYKRYQDRYLLKGFLLKNDPTRWNLRRPCKLSVQPKE